MKKIAFILVSCLFICFSSFAQKVKHVGYIERGKASYYPDNRKGIVTTSGEPYDMTALTASCKNIAYNTFIKITNLDNGEYIIARVNDRIYSNDRVVDLTKEGAKKLGIIGKLETDVKIEILHHDPSKKILRNIEDEVDLKIAITEQKNEEARLDTLRKKIIEKKAEIRKNSEIAKELSKQEELRLIKDGTFTHDGSYKLDGRKVRLYGFGIQLGAFTNMQIAFDKARIYKAMDYKKLYIQSIWLNGKRTYRLLLGEFDHKDDTSEVRNLLKAKGHNTLVREHI